MKLAARRTLLLAVLHVAALDAARAETLKVFAAASLKETFEAAAAQYGKENPGDEVELNLAGSQVLSQQIQQGAAADVFASADRTTMDELRKLGLAKGDRIFARNRLVLVAAKEAKLSSLADAARPGVRIVLASRDVPVGRYTARVLDKIERDNRYGRAFTSGVLANSVSEESSARAVLMKVVLGEADAGFVYATDAATAPGKIRLFPIPDDLNLIAAYPIAVLVKSESPEKARKFVEWLLGKKGQSTLRERGFLPAE